MTYTVIKAFTDLQDDGHKYHVGDTYPREGYEPTVSRITELSGSRNRQRTPLIEAAKVADVAEQTKPKRRRKQDKED